METAGASTPQLAEAHDLAGLLMGVANRTRRQFEDSAAALELSPTQARAVLALKEPIPMRALAEHLRCDASNITGLADRLEEQALVERRVAPQDRRVKLLALTAKGRDVREQLAARVAGDAPVMTELSSEERTMLRALLSKVADLSDPAAGCEASEPRD